MRGEQHGGHTQIRWSGGSLCERDRGSELWIMRRLQLAEGERDPWLLWDGSWCWVFEEQRGRLTGILLSIKSPQTLGAILPFPWGQPTTNDWVMQVYKRPVPLPNTPGLPHEIRLELLGFPETASWLSCFSRPILLLPLRGRFLPRLLTCMRTLFQALLAAVKMIRLWAPWGQGLCLSCSLVEERFKQGYHTIRLLKNFSDYCLCVCVWRRAGGGGDWAVGQRRWGRGRERWTT